MPTNFLDRYLQGEQEPVWDELLALGGAIRQEPLFTEALAVTRETMRRARYNIELLVLRLNAIGYVFGVYPNDRRKLPGYTGPHNPPGQDIANKISKLEALEGIGSLPLSLQVFWEIVGEVNFIGYHPAWPEFSDPLVIFPIEAIHYDYTEWRELVDEGDPEARQFGLQLSPDVYHKDNVSGGEPYSMRVPNFAIDGMLEYERHSTTFVNYLRITFRYGGFPGVQWAKGAIPGEMSGLADGLLPI